MQTSQGGLRILQYLPSGKISERHFIAEKNVNRSATPASTNVVSNKFPSKHRLLNSEGKHLNATERPKDLFKFYLSQKCRSWGIFYNLLAKDMTGGLAEYDVSILYITTTRTVSVLRRAEY